MAEVIGWILGIAICIALPLALGYWARALAGAGGLAPPHTKHIIEEETQ